MSDNSPKLKYRLYDDGGMMGRSLITGRDPGSGSPVSIKSRMLKFGKRKSPKSCTKSRNNVMVPSVFDDSNYLVSSMDKNTSCNAKDIKFQRSMDKIGNNSESTCRVKVGMLRTESAAKIDKRISMQTMSSTIKSQESELKMSVQACKVKDAVPRVESSIKEHADVKKLTPQRSHSIKKVARGGGNGNIEKYFSRTPVRKAAGGLPLDGNIVGGERQLDEEKSRDTEGRLTADQREQGQSSPARAPYPTSTQD